MPPETRWRVLNLFVSSTFSDLHAERDHLRHVVFPELEQRLRARRVHLQVVDLRWGVDTLSLAEEAEREREVLRYCLEEVERCRPFLLVLLAERYGYVPDPARLPEMARLLGRPAREMRGKSVTELEIEAGLLADPNPSRAYRIFMRDKRDMAGVPDDRLVALSDRAAGRGNAVRALSALKRRLRALAPERCAEYRAQWEPGRGSFAGLEPFGEAVREALWVDLDAHTASRAEAAAGPATPLARHKAETAELLELQQERFVGRGATLRRLERFALGATGPSALLVTAPTGAGKTSVMATLAARLEAARDPPLVLAAFFGTTAAAHRADAAVRVFSDLLADASGAPRLDEAIAQDRLFEGFAHLLSCAAARRRVVLLLDALDRIDPTEQARPMGWLPLRWPPNARVVATAIDGPEARAFAARMAVGVTSLPPLPPGEARALVRHLCSLEHRKPARTVMDAVLGVRAAGGYPASANPLWLTIAVGQLNRLQGSDFLLAAARLERRPDAQLAGYLADWAARLPGDAQSLFTTVLRAAEGHFGIDVLHLAAALAAARRGWRESDLLGILSQLTRRPWQPLMLLRLRHALRGAVSAGQGGLWRFAHHSLAVSVATETARVETGVALHAAIVRYLRALPADDPIRRRELAHHALRANEVSAAAHALASDLDEEDEPAAIEDLAEELRMSPPGADWLRGLLWADGLHGGERLRLADRLQEASDKLARGYHWASCQAALALLSEFYGGAGAGLLETREALFRQARVAASFGACARALGDHEAAIQRLSESGQLTGTLIAGCGEALQAQTGSGAATIFSRGPTLDRAAEWCDVQVQSMCAVGEVLMEHGHTREASWILGRASTVEMDYPPPLKSALSREQPLRTKGTVAFTSAVQGLFWLWTGSGTGAFGHFHQAHGRLLTILSFTRASVPLRRELVVLEARMAQALLLAGAPGASVRTACSALRVSHDLCREMPGVGGHRLDRAFVLRCIAAGWDALGETRWARRARALAASDIVGSIDADVNSAGPRRTLAWARAQPAESADIAALLGRELPDCDYARPQLWSTEDAVAEAGAVDPARLARWREEVLDGPRFADWFRPLRITNFGLKHAFAQHGAEALTKQTISYTTPDGVEHAVRDLEAGIAERFDIDGEAVLAALRRAAENGDREAQAELGVLCTDGVFGTEFDREGRRWLWAAARAGSDEAAFRLGEMLLAAPDDSEGWRQGAELLRRPAQQRDPRALSLLASVHLHGRGASKDPARGIGLLREAAEQGDLRAAYHLGVYLDAGELVQRDRDAARVWYEKAASGGDVSAMTNLAMLLLALGRETTAAVEWLEQASDAGDPLAMAVLAGQLMKSDPAPETLVRARSLLERAVRAGHKASYHTLGYMIAGGLGGAQDLDAGLRLIGEAAARGSAAAAVVLAFLQAATRSWPVSETALEGLRQLGWSGFHIETLVRLASAYREREAAKVAEPVRLDDARSLFERGVHLSQEAKPPDYRGAHECYAGAAALGYPEAMYNLAYLYLNGEGVDRDVPTGLDWMRRAAESGKPHMQYNLAVLLNEGILAEPDREQAVHWYRRAADQGYPQALHNLAWCYLQGTGVGRDPDAALALFRRAAASGLPESVSMVAKLA